MPTELGPLLREIAERASSRDAARIEVELEEPITLPLRPGRDPALPVANLIDNAVAPGPLGRDARGHAARDQVWIAVDDDGPGIPEPTSARRCSSRSIRLDPSRNPSTGGVGLGLTIARDIVLGHGGDIELSDAPTAGCAC